MSNDDTDDSTDRETAYAARASDANEDGDETDRRRGFGPGPKSLARNRTVVTVGGGLLALLGVVAIATPFFTGITLSLVFGAVLVAGGFARTAAAFSAQGWGGAIFEVFLATVYGVAGVVLLVNPVLGLTTLTLVLGAYFLVEGIVQMLMGLGVRMNDNWGWLLFSGAISLVLASLVLLEFPSSADWAVGLLFGVNLLTSGLALVLVGLGAETDRDAQTTGRVGEPRSEP